MSSIDGVRILRDVMRSGGSAAAQVRPTPHLEPGSAANSEPLVAPKETRTAHADGRPARQQLRQLQLAVRVYYVSGFWCKSLVGLLQYSSEPWGREGNLKSRKRAGQHLRLRSI